MNLRTNLIILFCFFWFLATFSAWHDADKNLRFVEKQRQQDVGDLGTCRTDLRATESSVDFFQKQANVELSNFGLQQSALDACVVALGKTNTPEPLKIRV